jgi:hypothetical protein
MNNGDEPQRKQVGSKQPIAYGGWVPSEYSTRKRQVYRIINQDRQPSAARCNVEGPSDYRIDAEYSMSHVDHLGFRFCCPGINESESRATGAFRLRSQAKTEASELIGLISVLPVGREG